MWKRRDMETMAALPGGIGHKFGERNFLYQSPVRPKNFFVSSNRYTTQSGESYGKLQNIPVLCNGRLIAQKHNLEMRQKPDRALHDGGFQQDEGQDHKSAKCMVCTSKMTAHDFNRHLLFGTLKCSSCYLVIERCQDIWKCKKYECIGGKTRHSFEWSLIKLGTNDNKLRYEYDMLEKYLSITKACRHIQLYEFAYKSYEIVQKDILIRLNDLKDKIPSNLNSIYTKDSVKKYKIPKLHKATVLSTEDTTKKDLTGSEDCYKVIKLGNDLLNQSNKLIIKKSKP